MLGNLNGWHLIILLAVVLLLFGAPKLPGLAKSVGQSMRIFRREVKTLHDDDMVADVPEAEAEATTAEPGASAKP